MATHKFPYEQPDKAEPVNKTNETPAQKKATDKPDTTADEKRSESEVRKADPTSKDKNADNGRWEQAEHSARNMGGFSGTDEAGRKRLTQEQFDRMEDEDKRLHAWAGDGAILGENNDKKQS